MHVRASGLRHFCRARLGWTFLCLGLVVQDFVRFHAASSNIAAARNTAYVSPFYHEICNPS